MISPALSRRTRRGLNKWLGRPCNVSLRIVEWKTIVLHEWEENGVKHNSHKHAFSIASAGEAAHTHTQATFAVKPGANCTATHAHSVTVDAGTNHIHTFSGYTGLTTATDLNHTHTISITSQAGDSHTHGFPTPWPAGGCAQCVGNEHTHVAGGDNSGEATHTHGLSGATGNGVGILRWHKHGISLTSIAGLAHSHTGGTGAISEVSCNEGYPHDHNDTIDTSSEESAHTHDVIGDTEDEGEPIDGSTELLGKFEVGQDSAELLGRGEVQHTGTPVELLGKGKVQQSNTAELLGKTEIQKPGSAELPSNFRVKCLRRFGGNWQRKMWFDGTYYWRGRYDPLGDELIFEYIAATGLAGNVWTKNAAASIDVSGFTGITADFTVRGGESGIPTTIHYSDGVDTRVAESDEASATGWAWENTTVVFDGTAPDYYRKVNLCANRTTPTPRLWVVAVFYDDDPDGKQWVKARRQTTGGNLANWDAEVDISNVDNTSTIYGCSVRSMGATGALKNDIMVVYKEGIALRSRYYTGVTWQAIQNIDTTTLTGRAVFDFEHGDVAGENEGHVVYVDADSAVQWRERDSGAAPVWSAAEELHGAIHEHFGVGIVEHGSEWLWIIWVDAPIIEYRVHLCATEIWYPLLANDPLFFDPSTEGIIATSTAEQPQTPDFIPSGEAVPMCWIGETAPTTPCAVAWGILLEYSIASLKGVLDVRQLTSTDLTARLEVGQDSAELLGKGIIRHSDSADLLDKADITHSIELLGRAIIRQPGSANLFGKADITHSVELLGRAIVRQLGSAELLGKAVIRHVGSPVELLGKAEVRQPGSAELLGRAIIRHMGTPAELLGRTIIRQLGSAELIGKAVIRHVGTPAELLGKAVIRHVGTPAELLGRAIIRQPGSAELFGKTVIRHSDTAELLGKGIIRHTNTRELVARCVIRHSATKNLDANVEIVHWEDLYGKTKIRHTATPLNLPAIFWTRFPRRLWTSRRYINGVIELDEKLLGDAILEYVIEGVMEDTQGYLDNAGLSYSEWIDITLVPVQILRAVTYGTVAALYARHTQTFRSQVIPSVTPVTVTVIGDAEKALDYWEDRMEQMLEYYVTSQGGEVMLTSTPDEEPVFSMEDIPEEVTEFVSWRIWLQERSES